MATKTYWFKADHTDATTGLTWRAGVTDRVTDTALQTRLEAATGPAGEKVVIDLGALLVESGDFNSWPLSADVLSFLEQGDADHVNYDNTASGLTADDIQAAIDEIVDGTCALLRYERGTFTPEVTFVTPGNLSMSYIEQRGDYELHGDLCTFDVDMAFTPTHTTASGASQFDVPFPASLGAGNTHPIPMAIVSPGTTYPTSCTMAQGLIFDGTSVFALFGYGNGVGQTTFDHTNIVSGSAQRFRYGTTYRIA